MDKMEHIGFHECTVVQFRIDNNTLKLILDGARINENDVRVVLNMSEVTSASADGTILDIASTISMMEAEDGEVLTLNISDGALSLVVEWHDFLNKKFFTKSYRILGKDVFLSEV